MLPVRPRLFIVLYLLSGAAALLYEVAWLRLLTLSMGHTTGAVGAVLAAFMGGLAIGAWFAGRASAALVPQRALRIYAALEATIAVCALLMPFALGAMRPLLAWAYADGSGGATFDIARLTVSVVLIALPAAAMGASFPVGVVAIRDSGFGTRDSQDSKSQGAGELYAAGFLLGRGTFRPAQLRQPTLRGDSVCRRFGPGRSRTAGTWRARAPCCVRPG